VKSTFAAEVAMDLDKQQIIDDAVAMAEKLDLGENDSAIFDVQELGLKVEVRFASGIIHVMTVEEAKKAGLPGSG
jgi:hypothetical protein